MQRLKLILVLIKTNFIYKIQIDCVHVFWSEFPCLMLLTWIKYKLNVYMHLKINQYKNIFIEKNAEFNFSWNILLLNFLSCQISFNIMQGLNVWDQQTAGEWSENQLTSLLFPGQNHYNYFTKLLFNKYY